MRRQIPRGVDVHPDRPEVRADHRHVIHPSEIARLDILPDAPNGGVVEKDVANHQNPIRRGRQRTQFLCIGHAIGDRFFDEHVLARLQCGLHERVVGTGRGRNHNRVYVRIGPDMLDILRQCNVRESLLHLSQPAGVLIDNGHNVADRRILEIADEVRPPVASPDDRDADRAH